MIRTLLIFTVLASVVPRLYGQTGEITDERAQDRSISWTVPLSVEYERFLKDSILSRDEAINLGKPLSEDITALKGEFGVGVKFYALNQEDIDTESIIQLLSKASNYFNFNEILDIELSMKFCFKGADLIEIADHNKLSLPLADANTYEQRAWFSRFANDLKDVADLRDNQDAIRVLVVDMDAIGFASTAGHGGPTDIIVIPSKLLRGEISERLPEVTLAHLMATFLGVKPLWYNEQGYGDLVDDTPCHDAPNFGSGENEIHISLCQPMQRELSYNLMDNLNDKFRFGFTKGQLSRLIANLLSDPHRKQLLDSPCRDEKAERAMLTLATDQQDYTALLQPNPANESVTLQISEGSNIKGSYRIMNASGAGVAYGIISGSTTVVKTQDLQPGIYYFLTEIIGASQVMRNRLIVSR